MGIYQSSVAESYENHAQLHTQLLQQYLITMTTPSILAWQCEEFGTALPLKVQGIGEVLVLMLLEHYLVVLGLCLEELGGDKNLQVLLRIK